MKYRQLLFLVLLVWLAACSTKPATTKQAAEYYEDLSSYRPAVDPAPEVKPVESATNQVKTSYVAATHDINAEMAIAMDSLISANTDKTFQTYTIQVYLGRSREEANQAREKVYRVLPSETPELSYKQPSFRVTVGTYFDRVEAYKTLNILKTAFASAMLVPEKMPLK